jgi:hypothetical protein
MRLLHLAILFVLTSSFLGGASMDLVSAVSRFEAQITRAVDYLVKRFNSDLGLIYESDDPGRHWLADEVNGFRWRYNQTYWLYSDNLFAAYALEPFRRDIADRIKESLQKRKVPPSLLFEAVIGERIPTIRNAVNYIVESSSDYVIMARRHDSPMISYGLYADLICYRSLQAFLEERIPEARRLFRQAVALWNGKGLDDWSYRFVDGFYSNQKLALLLYTSKVLGFEFSAYAEMERHLWSLQQNDGGIVSLSDGEGKAMGSSNVETTAMTLLTYNEPLLQSIRSKVHYSAAPSIGCYVMSSAFILVTAAVFLHSSEGLRQAKLSLRRRERQHLK